MNPRPSRSSITAGRTLAGALCLIAGSTAALATFTPAEVSAHHASSTTDTLLAEPRVERGNLRRGDRRLTSGEYCDSYTIRLNEGQRITLRLESEDFDSYLILQDSSDENVGENDDAADGNRNAAIEFTATESGRYEILVTSFEPRETGEYVLTIDIGDAGEPAAEPTPPRTRDRREPTPRPDRPARPPADEPREAAPVTGEERMLTQDGALRRGDDTLDSGEFVDTYTIEAQAGQHLVFRVTSDDFDTYLIAHPPEGEQLDNDDHAGSTSQSYIETTATTAGQWRVQVTSFKPGMDGDYELTMSVHNSDRFYEPGDAQPISPADGTASGELTRDDLRRFTGEFGDVFSFEGEPGRFYTAEVTTRNDRFDTLLLLDREGGARLVNDDYAGSTQRSRIEFLVTQPGPVNLIVSSFAEGMTGRYDITLSTQDAPPEHHHEPSVVPGRVFGVFAGITDYSQRDQANLDYCANDAQRAFDAAVENLGMSEGDAVLLKDDDATVEAFESAIRSLGSRLDYDDVLVVFYSGHGGQTDRTTLQPADPDMLDEILVLADEDLTDDSLDETLRSVERGTVLLVLDSCNSGGFAKDVISRPGRMGLFASAEDCLSIVAPERGAGGYLSDFFIECIGSGRQQADTSGNNEMTVIEMCQFIADRYRTEVTSDSDAKPPATPRGPYERTISPTEYRGYQQLLIDRGSIGPHEVLFGW